jgi:hypothetical protein
MVRAAKTFSPAASFASQTCIHRTEGTEILLPEEVRE